MNATRLLALALLAGCATVQETAEEVAREAQAELNPGPRATATLLDPQGRQVGTVTLQQEEDGVDIEVHATALPPGLHGIHLHAVGACAAPDFTSAGGHFNPAGRQHGFNNPQGPHAGDLQNIEVGAGGGGHFVLENERVTLVGGEAPLLDADGAAVVVHAGPDDYRTDPAGNSGARIACGVITR